VARPRFVWGRWRIIRVLRVVVHVVTIDLFCSSGRVPNYYIYCELLQSLGRTTADAGLDVLGWISSDADLCGTDSICQHHHDPP